MNKNDFFTNLFIIVGAVAMWYLMYLQSKGIAR